MHTDMMVDMTIMMSVATVSDAFSTPQIFKIHRAKSTKVPCASCALAMCCANTSFCSSIAV